MQMKILICFGTRPEAIKMAPLVLALKNNPAFNTKVLVTAQHREMLDQVLSFFSIIPDFDLDLMAPNQSLNKLSARILDAVDQVLDTFIPDYVLVHGDTTTSSMVALASFHKGIKIGHVEAGLRTYNKLSPFPEEMNRQITGKLADIHFAPTKWAAQNLVNEKCNLNTIFTTGNTVIDALYIGLNKIKQGYVCPDLERIKNTIDTSKKLILITGHRRENFGQGFENLCLAIKEIAKEPNVQIIYPVHLNPNVQEPVNRILKNIDNIHLIQPLDYPAFIYAMEKAYFILTDSGGVQEEAPSLGKPVLVMRNTTERPEAVQAGTVKLVGTNTQDIISNCLLLLQDKMHYDSMSMAHNPYGDGNAVNNIINGLINS